MKLKQPQLLIKILIIGLVIIAILGFFYFENSLMLRVLSVLLGIVGIATIASQPEIVVFILLYLSYFDLYNIRYGLAVPLAVVMLPVFGITVFSFYGQNFLLGFEERTKKVLNLYTVLTGLVTLEIFLTMTFWPVDPKLKTIVIIVVYYLIERIFHLYINSVLNLRKIVGFFVVSIIILAIVILFNLRLGI